MQNWSGGIAGRSGANYYYEIEFSDFSGTPVPDTLWLGKEPIALTIPDSPAKQFGNLKRKLKNGITTFMITAQTVRDDYEANNPYSQKTKALPKPCVPSYKGVALLSYRYGGKEHFFEIGKIQNVLTPANYP